MYLVCCISCPESESSRLIETRLTVSHCRNAVTRSHSLRHWPAAHRRPESASRDLTLKRWSLLRRNNYALVGRSEVCFLSSSTQQLAKRLLTVSKLKVMDVLQMRGLPSRSIHQGAFIVGSCLSDSMKKEWIRVSSRKTVKKKICKSTGDKHQICRGRL